MSRENFNGLKLKSTQNGGSEILEDNETDTHGTDLNATRQQVFCEEPNGLRGDKNGGPEILNNNQGDPQDGHQEFDARFDVKILDLSGKYMELKENQTMARAMETGKLTKLEVLMMQENHGDLGMRAMLKALGRKHLVGLRQILLWEVSSYDQISFGEEGTEMFADALADCALPNLEVMDLRGFLPKLQPSRTRFEALMGIFTKCSLGDGRLRESSHVCLGCLVFNIRPGTIQTLECLRCMVGKLHVFSGDTGIRKIAEAFRKCPIMTLKELFLEQNYIGDKGASDLAKILRRGLLPSLERLDLKNNPVGKDGAEDIIFAFLRNPLLTAEVQMEWPNVLQKQRYVAFRESNLRLEWRLKDPDFGIENSQVVINEFNYPQYTLRRPLGQSGKKSKSHPHRLRFLCQAHAHAVNHESFEVHHVKISKKEGLADPDGIEFRILSIFTPSPPKYVKREPEASQESLSYGGVDTGTTDRGAEEGVAGRYVVSGPLSSVTLSIKRKGQDIPLKRTKAVNRICIKKRSLAFVASAKAFGSQDRRSSPESLIGRVRRSGLLTYPEKTKEAMKAIVQELLMLADRKPSEFFGMFGLRQVLLKNPKKSGLRVYSRCWICDSCFQEYKRRNPHSVFPITRDLKIRFLFPRV